MNLNKLLSGTATKQQLLNINSIRSHYGGTWKLCHRLQNPDIVKNVPTFEFVKNGQFKKTRLVYICGLGAMGSLGMEKYYRPDVKEPNKLKTREYMTPIFKRLGCFKPSDRIVDVACGYGFTIVAAQVSGTSYTALGFGLNSHSQIGYHAKRTGYPLEIVSLPSPIVLPSETPIVKVSCGRSHSILLNQSGQVFSLGNNSLGQCGRPIEDKENYFGSKRVHKLAGDLPKDVISVECGQDHSFFLTSSGQLYACGWSADGQTGLGHYDNQPQPSQVKGDIQGAHIVKVSSFADTVLALDRDGNLFGWGNSEYAQFRQLANSESEQFNVPRHLKLRNVPGKIVDIAAGGTVCAILNDRGQVFVWGFGILGKGPNVDQSSEPTLIPESLFGMNVYNPETRVEKIFASLSNFAAITNLGDLYTWGKNRSASLGFSHQSDQYFPMRVNMNLANVRDISLGVNHTCALVEKVC